MILQLRFRGAVYTPSNPHQARALIRLALIDAQRGEQVVRTVRAAPVHPSDYRRTGEAHPAVSYDYPEADAAEIVG